MGAGNGLDREVKEVQVLSIVWDRKVKKKIERIVKKLGIGRDSQV